ncbi:hypothetical protein RFI_23377, partial [Reticulomyxa filosa]
KYKLLKKVQEIFTEDTDMFLNKPKIFIKNACREECQQQSYNRESDTLLIYSTTPGKYITDLSDPTKEKGSYFTEFFCKVMSENSKSSKPLFDNLQSITGLVKGKESGAEIIQTTSTFDRHVFLYINNFSIANPKKEMKNQNVITLDAKKKVNTEQSCSNKIGILVNCWFKRFGCNHTCLDQDSECHLITNMKLHFYLVHKVFLDMKSQSILLKKTILSMQQEIKLKKGYSIAENKLIKEELQKCQASIETIKKEFNDKNNKTRKTY